LKKGLPDTAPQGADKGSEIWRVATTLDEEHWKIRDKIGDLYQRALTRLLGGGIAFALAVWAADDDWEVPLLGLAGLALVSATSAAMSGFRYRRLFSAKWAEEMEHLLLRFARQSGNTLRTVEVAEPPVPMSGEGERLRTIRLRALHDAPDAFGATLEEAEARPLESWDEQLEKIATFVATTGGCDQGLVRARPTINFPMLAT